MVKLPHSVPNFEFSCVSCTQVPEGHRERMRLAEMSFFWHRVYDPWSKTCVHFCDAAPELIGTAEVPDLPATADGTAFLGCVSVVCRCVVHVVFVVCIMGGVELSSHVHVVVFLSRCCAARVYLPLLFICPASGSVDG